MLSKNDFINFNLCVPLQVQTCGVGAYAARIQEGNCMSFTKGQTYARLNSANNLEITRQSEHLCNKNEMKYANVTIELHCAPYQKPSFNETGPCDFHVYMRTLQGCP